MGDIVKFQLLERRFNRERLARKEAERILEEKASELYQANEQLKQLNESLEVEIEERSEDLRQTKVRYKHFVETANEIIYETTAEGIITYVNPFASKMLFYTNEEIIGKHFLKFIVKDFRKELIQYYEDCIRNNVINSYLEIPALRKDMEVLWVGQSVTLDFEILAGKRQLVGVRAIARDITDKYYARRKLELSEEKYRNIMEHMELGFLEVDLEGVVVKAYERFCQMTGWTNKELVGRNAMTTFLPEEYQEEMKQIDKSRKHGVVSSYELELTKKSGKKFWALISGGPVFNEKGEIVGSVGIHYDISEQKRIQAELTSAKQIGEAARKSEQQFLANISHEIRTPLNAIIGMSHLLYDADPTPEQKEYLEMIKYSANFLYLLISDVLDMSKIQAGQLDVKEEAFDIYNLLRTIQKTFQFKAQEKDIDVQLEISSDVERMYVGDEVLLNQILMNVVGNAEKFTTNGIIKIEVSASDIDETSVFVHFKITDSGIGVSEDKLSDIFKKFKQVHNENDVNTEGTGLGLAIVKQLLKLQNGNVTVSSEVGKGTVFDIFIPYRKYQNKFDITDQKTIIEAVKNISELKILVVEDNPINQRYVGAVLKRLGIAYEIAENGKVACEMTDKNSYDMILLDIQMPVMNGYEAAKYIRKTDTPNKSIPIIALTASVMAIVQNKAIESGMDDVLSKPFTPADLKKKVEKYYIQPIIELLVDTGKPPIVSVEIDSEVIDSVYNGDKEFQQIVFESFAEEIAPQVEKLRDAYNSKDIEAVGKAAHQMKPTFGMVGLPKYQKDLETIEKKIKADNILPEPEEQLLKDFLNDVPQIIITIKKTIEDLK
ncbi:MAG: PAS domain S-box-containing protein [Spirosomataceae bacterium]|jgi:PAS domain S-box-containing protein